jgi:hypothetical protein
MTRILACFVLLAAVALPAQAPPLLGVTVTGNALSVTISLPGDLSADLTVSFGNVVGLSLANLGLSVRVVNPFDLALLARLPGGTLTSALPVMLRIEPPATGGLSFSGVVQLDLHTHNLLYNVGCPLRLFSAPLGGQFRDITAAMGSGSYRVRGTSGGFSEFLIVLDLRSIDQVITSKLNALDGALDAYEGSMPGSVYSQLEASLATIRSDFNAHSTVNAIGDVDDFLALVAAHSGTDLPNVWRSARDVTNVAGYLQAGAETLRFSLDLKRTLGY